MYTSYMYNFMTVTNDAQILSGFEIRGISKKKIKVKLDQICYKNALMLFSS